MPVPVVPTQLRTFFDGFAGLIRGWQTAKVSCGRRHRSRALHRGLVSLVGLGVLLGVEPWPSTLVVPTKRVAKVAAQRVCLRCSL